MNNRAPERTVKRVMALLGLGLAAYIIVPRIYWHISDFITPATVPDCPSCFCDCSSQPLLSLSDGLSINTSFPECMKRDPDMSEKMEKSFTGLLTEEVKRKEAEAVRNQQRADVALLEAKKMASQFQKEADKCSAGMDTCEVAREKADEALISQRHISSIWEIRARQRGWRPSTAIGDLHYIH